MAMFNWLNLKDIFSTPEEWHSFVVGFFEVLCPWPSRVWMSGDRLNDLLGEYHYYMTGRGIGFIALLLILAGIATLFIKVVL